MSKIDWNIRARAHACSACGREFADKETCRSAVVAFEEAIVREIFAEKFAEEEAAAASGQSVKPHPEYVRLDFCEDCFKARSATPWISAWKTVYVPPEPEDPRAALKKESYESLLRRLIEGDDAENHLPAIFLLALQLERKKILVERSVKNTPEGDPVHVYENRKSGDILIIRDPGIEPEQIPEIQDEIERLLGLKPSVEQIQAEMTAEAAAAAQSGDAAESSTGNPVQETTESVGTQSDTEPSEETDHSYSAPKE